MIMKRKFPVSKAQKFRQKMEERKIQLLEGVANALATPKAP